LTGGNSKQFVASEYTADPTLRPTLTVSYTQGAANVPPTVVLTSPAVGASVVAPASVVVSADASDGDGSVSRVDFYAGTTLLGSDSTAPYSVTWSNVGAGSYSLTAVAVDSGGASTTSSPVLLTVTAATGGPVEVVLRRGVVGSSVADVSLESFSPTTPLGAGTVLNLNNPYFVPVVRFAVFAAEGGPVPDGAVIQSATLKLYKQYYDGTFGLYRLLKPWVEAEATWNSARAGVLWAVPGADGAGTDYDAVADATAAGGFNPGWVSFDVTTRLRSWSTASTPNHGWRLRSLTGGNSKQFVASEYTADPTLRPTLTVRYSN
jgi:hypothetical protein